MERFLLVSSLLLWAVVLFNLMLTLSLVRRFSKMMGPPDIIDVPTLEVGTRAPDFQASTMDNQIVDLTMYSRKSVGFIFISPSCTPCIEKMPIFHQIEPQARDYGVNLVLVSLADREETKAFVQMYSIKMPILFAPRNNNPFAENYKVAGTPFYCLLDKDGKVQSAGYLDTRWEQLVQTWNKKM